MDETGDQCVSELNALTLNDKMTDKSVNNEKVLIEIMDEMIAKCESTDVTTAEDSEPMNSMAKDSRLRRLDSEAMVDNESNGSVGPTEDTEELIRVSVVSTQQTPDSEDDSNGCQGLATTECLTPVSADLHKDVKTRTEKWGESVGIFNSKGCVKRVIDLSELKNYLYLKSSSLKTESNIYCSLINERFPRFFDSTVDYLQRWRMRYNIFADRVLADGSDPSLVHMGEVHLYFDLIPKYSIPYYVNNSFYTNTLAVERPLDEESAERVKSVLESIRKTKDIFQLKFPINGQLFHNTNHIFEKFMERQQELIEESQTVNRKGHQRRRLFGRQRGRPQQPYTMRGALSRYERDFGQSSREFHQTGQQFARNERNFGQNSKKYSDFEDNRRGVNRSNGRGFGDKREMNRKHRPLNGEFRRRNSVDDSDVTFEDTRERYEKNDRSVVNNKTNRGFDRSERLDTIRTKTETNFRHNETNYSKNSRSLDYETQRRREEYKRDKQYYSGGYTTTQPTGALIDFGGNRYSNSGYNTKPLGHSSFD